MEFSDFRIHQFEFPTNYLKFQTELIQFFNLIGCRDSSASI